jgi:hypothetical protein
MKTRHTVRTRIIEADIEYRYDPAEGPDYSAEIDILKVVPVGESACKNDEVLRSYVMGILPCDDPFYDFWRRSLRLTAEKVAKRVFISGRMKPMQESG